MKSNKRESSENKPLLGKYPEDLLGDATTDDLLGLDTSAYDTDSLLKELASLDFGQTSTQEQEGSPSKNEASNQQDTFLANFDQVFGSTNTSSEAEWNSLLPSHFLANNVLHDDPPLFISDDVPSSLLSPSQTKDGTDKKSVIDSSKKVLIVHIFEYPSLTTNFTCRILPRICLRGTSCLPI